MAQQEENNLFDQTGELIRPEKHAMTWAQMKSFCEGLNEEQLKAKVIVWQEDEVITDLNAMQLDQDHYINVDRPELGCSPIQDHECQEYHSKGIRAEKFRKVYDKGHPVLWQDF